MKNIPIYILILLGFVSCINEPKNVTDNSTRYYLNKDSIEIIEFENKKIFRYFFRDSIKKELTEKNILYFSGTEDSLKVSDNNSLIYKKIELNTKDSIDLESSKYWTIRYKGKGQEWYTFFNSNKSNTIFKYYYYYNARINQDTIFSSSYSDNGGFRVFDKFNYMFIGKWDDTGGFVSKINDDSLLFIPVNSYSKVVNRPNSYLERYNSIKINNHLGNWELTTPSSCEFSNYVIGDKLRVYTDSLVFSNNNETLSKAKYKLGLDSKYFELMGRKNVHDLNMFWDIKILKQTETELKLCINYDGGLCKTTDTLIYKKINPQK